MIVPEKPSVICVIYRLKYTALWQQLIIDRKVKVCI